MHVPGAGRRPPTTCGFDSRDEVDDARIRDHRSKPPGAFPDDYVDYEPAPALGSFSDLRLTASDRRNYCGTAASSGPRAQPRRRSPAGDQVPVGSRFDLGELLASCVDGGEADEEGCESARDHARDCREV